MVSKAFLGREIECLLVSPIILLPYFIFCSIWILISNSSLELRMTPKCFWWGHLVRVLLLNVTDGYAYVFNFWKKTVSFACFLQSGLNRSFSWLAQLLIDSNSEIQASWELCVSITFVKKFIKMFIKKVKYHQQRFYIWK